MIFIHNLQLIMSRLNSIIIFLRCWRWKDEGAVHIFDGDQCHLYWGNMGGTWINIFVTLTKGIFVHLRTNPEDPERKWEDAVVLFFKNLGDCSDTSLPALNFSIFFSFMVCLVIFTGAVVKMIFTVESTKQLKF